MTLAPSDEAILERARYLVNGTAPNKWVIAGTVMTGTIMAVLDSSIVNVALPDMSGSLGATIEQITWVVTAYILAMVIIMPIIALLSARCRSSRCSVRASGGSAST